jgi:threonine/homoserine/homoserine lactone efflux protein
MPPFKYFHDIGEKAGKIANNTLEKVSYFVANALKGPGPFKFVVVGGVVAAIAGWAAEYGAKSGLHAIVHAVEHALHIAIPGMGFIFTAIKYIGYALLAYGLIKEIFLKEKPEEAKKLPENPEDSKEEGDKEKKEEK